MNRGIVRCIDDLGRLVIPKEMRRTLMMKPNEPLEILLEDDKIIIKKFSPSANYKSALESILKTVEDDYILDNEQKTKFENCLKEAIKTCKKF